MDRFRACLEARGAFRASLISPTTSPWIAKVRFTWWRSRTGGCRSLQSERSFGLQVFGKAPIENHALRVPTVFGVNSFISFRLDSCLRGNVARTRPVLAML